MSVVFTAGERHPKNYHAWTYARFIWIYLWQFPETQWQLPQLNGRVRTWCTSNVSDHSGWMFYLWHWGGQRPWRRGLVGFENPDEMVVRVVKVGAEVTPGHESLWAFVRGCIVGMENVLNSEEQETVMKAVQQYEKLLGEIVLLSSAEKKNLEALKRLNLIVSQVKHESLVKNSQNL
jgi:hypothetical protein